MATPAEDLANNIGKVNGAFTALETSLTSKSVPYLEKFNTALDNSFRANIIFVKGLNVVSKALDNFSSKQLDGLSKASDKLIISLSDFEKKLNNFNASGGGNNPKPPINNISELSVEALFFLMDTFKSVSNQFISNINIINQQLEQQYKLTTPMLDLISLTQNIYGKMVNSLMTTVDELDKLQQTALAMGTSFEFTKEALTGAGIDKIGGLDINLKDLQNSLTLYSQGFRQSNQNVLTLAKTMDMTGQKTSVLLEGLTRMSISLGMNNAQLNALAGIIDKTSLENKVTSEQLIETISQLKIKDTLGVLGIGGNFAAGMAQATAQFPQLRESMLLVANSLTDPKSIQNLMAYDPRFGQLARQLEAGGNFVEIFKNMSGGMQGFINMIKSASFGGATGLPGTTQAAMFAGPEMMPLLNAFVQIFQQMNEVSSGQLLQLQKEEAYSKSLTAQMQSLQSALMPLAVAILNVTSSKIKEVGAGEKLIQAFINGAKTLVTFKLVSLGIQIFQLVLTTAMASAQIYLATSKLSADLMNAGNAATVWANRVRMASFIAYGFGALGLVGAVASIGMTMATMISTRDTLDKFGDDLKIEHAATAANTRALTDNTAALTAGEMRMRATGQSSYFSVLARSIEYSITERNNNAVALNQVVDELKLSKDFLQKLLQTTATGLDVQIRNMGSQFGGGR